MRGRRGSRAGLRNRWKMVDYVTLTFSDFRKSSMSESRLNYFRNVFFNVCDLNLIFIIMNFFLL